MYRHYCKDTNCPGHTKSWERCCDLRAFSTQNTKEQKPLWTPSFFTRKDSEKSSTRKLVFA